MKLEEGMYIRTKNGCICQILRTTYSKYLSRNKELCYEIDRPINANMELYDEDIFKVSHNIIDLIQVGDYVNGWKVLYRTDGTKVVDDGYATNLDKISVKSIVTKEQMESMSYKVGE